MVTKTNLKMLDGTVVSGISVSGQSATFTFSDGTTKVLTLGTPGAITELSPSILETALGYVPANKAGDTFAGRVLIPAGSASAPSLTCADDLAQDSGFFWMSDGVIGVALNGLHQISFGSPTGGITANGNISGLSDESVKTNIEQIPDPIIKIRELMGVTFDRTDVTLEGGAVFRQTGLIAQHVLKVLPEAVTRREDGKLVVAYGNMMGLMVEGIKAVDNEVVELKKQVAELKDGLTKALQAIEGMRMELSQSRGG